MARTGGLRFVVLMTLEVVTDKGGVFETPEPPLEELMDAYPLVTITFPAGAWTDCGCKAASYSPTTFLDPPDILFPMEGDEDISTENLTVLWTAPSQAEAIRLEIEDEETEAALEIDLPGDATSFQVPSGWLQAGTEYVLDIKVISDNGNQTVRDIVFETAD